MLYSILEVIVIAWFVSVAGWILWGVYHVAVFMWEFLGSRSKNKQKNRTQRRRELRGKQKERRKNKRREAKRQFYESDRISKQVMHMKKYKKK